MSSLNNGVESAATGSPITAADGTQETSPSDAPGPAEVNADLDSGPTQTSDHATDSRTTQVSFNESNTTAVNDSSIQGGAHRYFVDQQPLRSTRSKPTLFPESLICR